MPPCHITCFLCTLHSVFNIHHFVFLVTCQNKYISPHHTPTPPPLPPYYTQGIQVFSPGGNLDVSSHLPTLRCFANDCVRHVAVPLG